MSSPPINHRRLRLMVALAVATVAAMVGLAVSQSSPAAQEPAASNPAPANPVPAAAAVTQPVPSATPQTLPAAIPAARVTPAPSTTSTVAPPQPPARPAVYSVPPNEAQPAAKQLGVDVVWEITNYEATEQVSDVAARLAGDDEVRLAEVTAGIDPVHHPGRWSRGAVEYAQLGGLRPDSASVMVVVRQDIGRGGEVEYSQTRTIDVRVSKVDGSWQFDRIADAGGDPVPRPDDLSELATSVVDDPRIQLADSARWDIYRGHTTPALLTMMRALADRSPYAAVVLSSGHPHHVFATDRVSNHSVGRAIDVYRLGDTNVIDDHDPDGAARAVVEWLFLREDLSEVGSPWALDGPGGRSFTDEVHHDHIHIGVRVATGS